MGGNMTVEATLTISYWGSQQESGIHDVVGTPSPSWAPGGAGLRHALAPCTKRWKVTARADWPQHFNYAAS